MSPEPYVGVDVAKSELVVAVSPGGEQWTVPNTEAGVAELRERLQRLTPALVVLEATGGYERAAVAALAAVQLPVVVANPRQVRDFARATGQLAKTDCIDADLLALFAERVRPTPRPLADEASVATGCPAHAAPTARCSSPNGIGWNTRSRRCVVGFARTSGGSNASSMESTGTSTR